jgi:hypothetical protein
MLEFWTAMCTWSGEGVDRAATACSTFWLASRTTQSTSATDLSRRFSAVVDASKDAFAGAVVVFTFENRCTNFGLRLGILGLELRDESFEFGLGDTHEGMSEFWTASCVWNLVMISLPVPVQFLFPFSLLLPFLTPRQASRFEFSAMIGALDAGEVKATIERSDD